MYGRSDHRRLASRTARTQRPIVPPVADGGQGLVGRQDAEHAVPGVDEGSPSGVRRRCAHPGRPGAPLRARQLRAGRSPAEPCGRCYRPCRRSSPPKASISRRPRMRLAGPGSRGRSLPGADEFARTRSVTVKLILPSPARLGPDCAHVRDSAEKRAGCHRPQPRPAVRIGRRNGSGKPRSAAPRRRHRDRLDLAGLGKPSRTGGRWPAILCSHRGGQGFKSPQLHSLTH